MVTLELFNDGSGLQHEEFSKRILMDSDGTGLDWYNMLYRNYDPQIGVFHNIDPMPSDMISPYSYAIDNPLMFEDPSGGTEEQANQETLGSFLYDALYNTKSSLYDDGGSWNSDGGVDDGSGDPDGESEDFGSSGGGLEAGAFYNMRNGYGDWDTNPAGAYAGAFYNYVTSTGNVDIPNYATFRNEFFQQLPEVTINEEDPNSWAAAQSTVYNEVQRSLDEITNMNAAEIGLGAAQLSFDATRYSAIGGQMLGNSFGGTSYAIQDLGKLQLAKIGRFGVSTELAGHALVGLSMALTGIDMYKNGINWSNGTDLVMEGVAFIPGVGWAISGAYFLGDIIVEHYTGESIGQHLGDVYNEPIVQEGINQQSIIPPTF
ncbi:MAG: hypothetical protein EPN39_13600 [Chitinophagaceae bacterium]|nr:MAG: hypothetical protein EPN39_13600 [Chitinophagaceae bacterium]